MLAVFGGWWISNHHPWKRACKHKAQLIYENNGGIEHFIEVGRTCETSLGLASIPACILAGLGVTGVAGDPGPDAPSNVLLTVPEAVRFDPAVDTATEGLAGKGLH